MLQISVLLILVSLPLRGTTQVSDQALTLEAKPQDALKNEKIVMTCSTPFLYLKGPKHFQFYRNNVLMKETEDGLFTIEKAQHADQASYRCELRIDYKNLVSNNLSITVSDGYVAFHVVPLSPLEGETLELNCRHRYKSQWERQYAFYGKGKIIHSMKSMSQECLYSIKVNSTNDSGWYYCKVNRLKSRTVEIHIQEAFAVPKLTVQPEGQLFDGQWFKLLCSVEDNLSQASLWYSFYKNGVPLQPSSTHRDYISKSARVTDSGAYYCFVTDSKVWKRSNQLNLSIRPFERPVLYIYPASGFVKEGETLRLQCGTIKGRSVYWYKNGNFLHITRSNVYEVLANSETGGSFHCKIYNSRQESETADVVINVSDQALTLEAKPQVALKNEKIVMTCSTPFLYLKGPKHFQFYRNNVLMKETEDGLFTIERAQHADQASYQCELRIDYKKLVSNNLSITVSDRDVAFHVVPLSPLEGETLELNCRHRYKYYWERECAFYGKGKIIHSMKSMSHECLYSIKVNSTDDSGWYYCKVNLWESQSIKIQVQERFAKPVLTVEPAAEVVEGLRLVLTCIVKMARPSAQLRYLFYRDSIALEVVPSDGSVFNINAATANISGNYACETIETIYGLRKRSDYTHISVKQAFAVPKLTVHPEGQLFDGQWFKLLCSVEDNLSQASLWYSFYRNGVPLQFLSTHRDYISKSARVTDSGAYHCFVTDSKVWKRSNQLNLSIRRIPVSKPNLIIQPRKELIEGEAGSLICSVSNGSLPIYYQFYNGSNMELHREFSNSSELVYKIGAISKRDEGLYHCSVRNEATDLPLRSEDIKITVIVPVADAVLISRTNGTEMWAGERLVLRCLVREGTEPQFVWYRNNVPLRNGSASSHVTADGGELVIHSFRTDNVGRYHCAAINKGINGTIFNVTSDYIGFTLREIAASLIPVLLFASLITSVLFIYRKRDTGNSSTVSHPSRSQPSGGGLAANNVDYAVVGATYNAENNAADLVYSVVTIRKTTEPCNSIGFSHAGKKDARTDPSDNSITYATLNLSKHSDEEDTADGNVYENILRK
ncbi:platelet endothelial cell adhesion molecule-like isoform X2 [Stegostoma tigrinum]|uniref:platelet endothelial cell adhesion molecule-like isoform X2 n=1 Tax=Stegostoma tigrinum TaxID=3053191 RepID=UPI00202B45BE|nr:platelet endothelial cell adhesion molecule-like isoform X2 [Stegostoma tigrinum]